MSDSQVELENYAANTSPLQGNARNDSAAPAVDAEDSLSSTAATRISAEQPRSASFTELTREPSKYLSRVRSPRSAVALLQPPEAEGARSDLSAVVRDALRRPQERQGNQASVTGGSATPSLDSSTRNRNRSPNSLSPSRPPRAGSSTGVDGLEGSSASSNLSPEMTRPSVATGIGIRERNVEPSVPDELVVSVPSYQEHLTSDGQRYTTYEIVVRMGGRQWSVRRRYSQFDQFRHSLRKQHKEVGSFRFPNKSKFNTFAEHTKERRRTGFDEFLRLVAGLHPRPQEVDVFLAMDEHGAGVSARAGSRPIAWTTGNASPVSTTPTDPALGGSTWSGAGGAAAVLRLPSGPGVGPPAKGVTEHRKRIPRFPPLADQGRAEKAAVAAAEAEAVAEAASRYGSSNVIRQLDLMFKRLFGVDVMNVLAVVAVSTATIVSVWKVGGRPGIVTLVISVFIGLFAQSWAAGQKLLSKGLELVGVSAGSSLPPSPTQTKERVEPCSSSVCLRLPSNPAGEDQVLRL